MAVKGRPTKWSPELEEQAWAYIEEYEKHGDAFPSVVGLCKAINRSRSVLYTWASDETKNFKDILATINEHQELVALNKGITGEYNATIVKLLLGKHGYHDKVDSTHASPEGGPVAIIERQIVKATPDTDC